MKLTGLISGILFLGCMNQAIHAADSPWLYGIHWFGSSSNNNDLADMAESKAIWSLETVMTNDGGQWGPQSQLAGFQNIVSQGHTLIMRVQPSWERAFPLPSDTNPNMAQFLDQVSNTALLYKDICHIWHLGNEMNITDEWGGQQLLPETYINAAAQFSDRIKAVSSSLGPQIVLVGPAGVGDQSDVGGSLFMSNTEYLTRMCQAIVNNGYQSQFDGFAIHAYASPNTNDVPGCLYEFESKPGHGYKHQIGIIDSQGFQNRPIYITEWNRYVGSVAGEAISAQFLMQAFAGIHTWNQNQNNHPVVCACWYVYHDYGGWSGYSLRGLKSNNPPNEDVWHAFESAAGQNYPARYPPGGGPTSTPGPTVTPTPTPSGCGGPGLLNTGFENGIAPWVAWGSSTLFDSGTDSVTAHGGSRMFGGRANFTTMNGGAWQQVAVCPGQECEVSAFIITRQVGGNDWDVVCRIGIDPQGGTNPASANIVWTSWTWSPEHWSSIGLTGANKVRAQASAITVFVENKHYYNLRYNFTMFDDVTLTLTGGIPTATPVPPTPSPSVTPPLVPTRTPTPCAVHWQAR